MIKVITYGTYDLLHRGHIRLLERAKALGDYLVVGVTADSFDRTRGKINVEQSLMERIEGVRSTGLADEIIVEEYEGQKIDDIKRMGIDIFTVGSDWVGKFDYLNEFCKVVYLERTQGVSSSEIRAGRQDVHIGLVGESTLLNKFEHECHFVNGAFLSGVYSQDDKNLSPAIKELPCQASSFEELLDHSDALYIVSHPSRHYSQIKQALLAGKHVLCESPIALSVKEQEELERIAHENSLVLMDSIKTAYSTAYNRMLLLVKSGRIGKVVSVDAVCTSLSDLEKRGNVPDANTWNSICAWGPTALLPVFQFLGTDYLDKQICSFMLDKDFDAFTKVAFVYPHALASVKIGKGAKSEGELIITGTSGYIYIPAPWWKTDYFEIRYENPADNKRYFYRLEGEGIRFEIVSFLKSIKMKNHNSSYIDADHSRAIVEIIEDFYAGNLTVLK